MLNAIAQTQDSVNIIPLSRKLILIRKHPSLSSDLGAHINGHVAMVGHTTVVNPDPTRPLIGMLFAVW